ncbi:MAG: RloB family protein [Roseiflexus sp.]|nr:RloB family protein [Roseiflexus sp.]
MRQRFLIVCEGSQTEPNYFRAFQVPGCVVQVTDTTQRGVRLIEEAIRRRSDDEYDQVWGVFDCDNLQPKQIHAAFKLAKQNKIKIAFSNQAFELWYLLHFHYHHVAMPRQHYCTLLQNYLGSYNKNRADLYNDLLHLQQTAIANARRLHQSYNPWDPATADPSTTVYLLVEELNRYRRP